MFALCERAMVVATKMSLGTGVAVALLLLSGFYFEIEAVGSRGQSLLGSLARRAKVRAAEPGSTYSYETAYFTQRVSELARCLEEGLVPLLVTNSWIISTPPSLGAFSSDTW